MRLAEPDNVATQLGPLAQLVARLVRIEEVRSSNLLGSTIRVLLQSTPQCTPASNADAFRAIDIP